MIVGFSNGCFDLLHWGHLHFLRECRKHCDSLVVGINSDASIKALKGPQRPIEGLSVRIGRLWSTKLVDRIVPFNSEGELLALIQRTAPHVLFKGDEYADKPVTGSELVKRIEFIPILPGHSTTAEIARRRA